jgi:hypothetical protein
MVRVRWNPGFRDSESGNKEHSSVTRPGLSVLRWVHTCNVTPYRNTASRQCGRDSWPRHVSKVGYAVTLRACSVRCRYLAVALKGWYGYGLIRSGRATWHVTTVRSSRLLYNHDASGSRNKLVTPWCNARRILFAMRHGMKVQIVTPYRVSHLQRYGVMVRGSVSCVYPPLKSTVSISIISVSRSNLLCTILPAIHVRRRRILLHVNVRDQNVKHSSYSIIVHPDDEEVRPETCSS